MTDLPVLARERCTLRPLVPADAASLQRHADDREVAYNLFDGFPQPYTMDAAVAWCGGESREPRFGHVFGITVNDAVIGCISVAPQGGLWACSAIVGYWIGRAHWRRGITSEALRLITAWGWANLPQITRLWMPIYARNAGSQAVARAAGYTLEGTMALAILKGGLALDAVQYGLMRPGAQAGEHRLPVAGAD